MDDSFGPRLLGHFDFTLLFEHTMLHIIPASVIVFAMPFYIYTLFHGTNVVRSGVLLWIKIFCALAMVGIQIANAVLWSQSALESQLAQAAAVMTSISAACMGIMVVVGHLYFPRPPSFLGLALTLTMIFDIGTTWTYFHRTGLESIARLHVPLPALKLVLICLEEVSKRNLIRSKALRSSLGQEALAGFWNRSLLLWVNPLLLFGFRREITMNVLPGVGPHLEAELLYQHFQRRWDKTNKVSRWALIKACVLTMPWPFLYIILPRLLAVGFNFAQPFLLQDVVNAVASDTESPIGLIRGLILATTAIYVGKAVSKSWYIHLKNQIMIGVRGILISAIYHKSLKLPADDLAEAAAVTLMNVDVTGVTHLISLSYESWARLLEMGLGIGILAVFVGAATLFTIIPTVITSIGSAYVARHMIATRRKWNEHMQDRIAATSNILVQIKDIKMLGLNTVLSNRLQKQFESEIDVSMTNRHQIAATFGIGDFATAMTPVLVIAGTIFWTRASEPISVARFFTTLAVVTLVSSPLSAFVQTLSSWSSGFACLVRIQNYLNLSETEDARCFALQAGVVDTDDLLPGAVSQASSNLRNRQRLTTSVVPYPVEITRVSVCTDLSGSILNDVSMHVPLGGITMVYGPVGCGKSTLLRTILARLPARDQTICGSDGCNLSGGQKQRISLARTLYTQAELLVLDDPFSSLDRETSSTIRIRLFSESHYLADNASTIVMTTSMRQHLVDADAIYKLDDTGQVEIRSLEQIQTESESHHDIQSRQMGGQSTSQAELTAATAVPTEKEFEPPQVIPTASSGARDNLSNKKYGDFTLYKYFLRPAGLYCVILWLSSIAIAAVAEKMPRTPTPDVVFLPFVINMLLGIYVRFWLADNPENRLYYIGYAGLGLIAPVLSYLQA
ncbi:ABC transporter C family member 8 [Beauveria bassiana]|uniref:ABC transporter C family member 8 n=1 Tax=Beauveria bassiana TaxID=176275 RepID=A0A2N6NQF1_BEABA|nr:ABC transporter C family member 8 [Beauveria bassiana]